MKRNVTLTSLRKAPPFAFQYCDQCGSQYSATPGDYFYVAEDYVFTCCGAPVRLVVRRCRLVDV